MSDAYDRLVEVMHRTYTECAWNRIQTHESLTPYLVEEAHEAVEALESGSRDDIVEELGDVLYSVVLHAEIGRGDAAPFDMDDVIAGLTDKLVRRHPHVFGDVVAETPEEVERVWYAVKAEEKAHRTSAVDGIPMAMPALALADKVIGRATSVGIRVAPAADAAVASEAALGAQLLALVAAARGAGIDPERALRVAARGLADEVRSASAP